MSDQLHEAVRATVNSWVDRWISGPPGEQLRMKQSLCDELAALLAAHPATKSEQEVLVQPSLAPDKTAELAQSKHKPNPYQGGPECGCDEYPECTHVLYWYEGLKIGQAHPAEPEEQIEVGNLAILTKRQRDGIRKSARKRYAITEKRPGITHGGHGNWAGPVIEALCNTLDAMESASRPTTATEAVMLTEAPGWPVLHETIMRIAEEISDEFCGGSETIAEAIACKLLSTEGEK